QAQEQLEYVQYNHLRDRCGHVSLDGGGRQAVQQSDEWAEQSAAVPSNGRRGKRRGRGWQNRHHAIAYNAMGRLHDGAGRASMIDRRARHYIVRRAGNFIVLDNAEIKAVAPYALRAPKKARSSAVVSGEFCSGKKCPPAMARPVTSAAQLPHMPNGPPAWSYHLSRPLPALHSTSTGHAMWRPARRASVSRARAL